MVPAKERKIVELPIASAPAAMGSMAGVGGRLLPVPIGTMQGEKRV